MGEELFLQIFRYPLLDDNVVAVELWGTRGQYGAIFDLQLDR
jgi:hypothetical protein